MSEYRCHQVAFLTMRGWTCNDRDEWKKPGKLHMVPNASFPFADGEIETDVWDLDDAYWEEQE